MMKAPFSVPGNLYSPSGSCLDSPFSHSRAHPETAPAALDATLPFPMPTLPPSTPQPEATSATKAFTLDSTRHHTPR